VIEVYADIWCPFTHVGLRTVVRRRTELGRGDLAIRVRSWPLELVNGAPMDVESTAAHIAELREQVAPDLFSGFDPRTFPRTTLPALGLAAQAYKEDGETGEAVSLALRDALFEEGRDISRPDVLAELARAHGIERGDLAEASDVATEWHEGEARGVRGSPHFFCGSHDAFCPSLVIERGPDGTVHLERNVEALDAFLQICFAES